MQPELQAQRPRCQAVLVNRLTLLTAHAESGVGDEVIITIGGTSRAPRSRIPGGLSRTERDLGRLATLNGPLTSPSKSPLAISRRTAHSVSRPRLRAVGCRRVLLVLISVDKCALLPYSAPMLRIRQTPGKISVLLPDPDYERFEAYCRDRGFKKSTLIARLIREHLNSENFAAQIELNLRGRGLATKE